MSQNQNSGGAPDSRPGREARDRDPREDVIAQKLRGLYDEVANQPVPDRFVELLDKLAKAEGKSEGERK